MIRCRENGPLVIKAPLSIVDHLGNAFVIPTGKEMIALCRCGHSANKPFCDGAHKTTGFSAANTAPTPTAPGSPEITSS
jgi:CDGSH-type Zn-finger protein